jgi:glucose uptake protein GlcU
MKRSVTVKYDPEPRRDWVRAAITLGLIAAFLVIIGFALYSTHGDYEKTKEMLDKLLPALTGLIGSALGFYFGSKNNQN